jgi:hypothetical protein
VRTSVFCSLTSREGTGVARSGGDATDTVLRSHLGSESSEPIVRNGAGGRWCRVERANRSCGRRLIGLLRPAMSSLRRTWRQSAPCTGGVLVDAHHVAFGSDRVGRCRPARRCPIRPRRHLANHPGVGGSRRDRDLPTSCEARVDGPPDTSEVDGHHVAAERILTASATDRGHGRLELQLPRSAHWAMARR